MWDPLGLKSMDKFEVDLHNRNRHMPASEDQLRAGLDLDLMWRVKDVLVWRRHSKVTEFLAAAIVKYSGYLALYEANMGSQFGVLKDEHPDVKACIQNRIKYFKSYFDSAYLGGMEIGPEMEAECRYQEYCLSKYLFECRVGHVIVCLALSANKKLFGRIIPQALARQPLGTPAIFEECFCRHHINLSYMKELVTLEPAKTILEYGIKLELSWMEVYDKLRKVLRAETTEFLRCANAIRNRRVAAVTPAEDVSLGIGSRKRHATSA
jgi:hypothetical protein